MTQPTKWTVDDGLPMPFLGRHGGAKLSRAEWDEYRRAQKIHHKQRPRYADGWHRPSKAVAGAVWDRLAPRFKITVENLLPALKIKPEEHPGVELTVKQAFVVIVDVAVTAGERERMLTTNTVFDALARRWSDNYRAAVEAGPARISYDMKAETVRASWRDLLRNGIRLEAMLNRPRKRAPKRLGLYEIVQRGCPGLYTIKRKGGPGHQRGYTVTVEEGSELVTWFRETVGELQPEWPRLLLSDETPPQSEAEQDVASEHAYNLVTVGQRGDELIRSLEQARFYLDVAAFRADFATLKEARDNANIHLWDDHKVKVEKSPARPRGTHGKTRRSPLQWQLAHVPERDIPKVKELVEQHRKNAGQVGQFLLIHKQLDDLKINDGLVSIRSGMKKIINRRYQPTNFWPLEVTGKDERSEVIESYDYEESGPFDIVAKTSRRGRWFRADAISSPNERAAREERAFPEPIPEETLADIQPLVGFDVSSSQMQILSVFLGLRDVEAEVTKRAFKDLFAKEAWEKHCDRRDRFKLPTVPTQYRDGTDPLLVSAAKDAAMTHLYGSQLSEVVYKLRDEPEKYGPGLGDQENLARLFTTPLTRYITSTFLPACQAVAREASRRDPYAGAVFTDPFDLAPVRWNPIRRKPKQIARGKTKVYVNLAVGTPNKAGDYPVDVGTPKRPGKFVRMIEPCLVHMLDAAFAGFVVEALHMRGVKNVVAVHDAWLVPAEGERTLLEAIEAAGEPWLLCLRPVYNALIRYLDKTEFGDEARQWKTVWQQRVARKQWPKFLVKPLDLWATDVRL